MKLRIKNSISIVISLFFLALSFLALAADFAPIKVAVASNFRNSLTEIAANYTVQSGQKVLISSASSGTLYNQIRHGAPFDLFLSADQKRAQLIEQSALGVKGSRFTYAQGQLAFWVPRQQAKVDLTTLKQYSGRFAIANPRLAPYGLAAEQALKALHLWRQFSYVQGANISQTYQFIESGNVEAGLVAYAQLLQNPLLKAEQYYLLPAHLHQPIVQQGVLLAAAKQPEKVQQFIDYLISAEVQALLREKGYL
ncbi:MAG TPA: molybdate ABC transporter substrate-binding protein [Psychromonas sp.]